jgi:V/A-type H+-transporting ATPase subunit A
LLREGVLQQSSLSANDAYCPPAKQQALLALVLAIEEQCLQLVTGGIPNRRIEEVDLSPAVRAREATPPQGAGEVEAISKQLMAKLGELT